MDIYCADIGSVKNGNFGWYGRQATGTNVHGQDIRELAAAIISRLNIGERVALGFEAPMFVPIRTNPDTLTQKREGETNKNWIGGPGGTVLATALVQVPWLLTTIRSGLSVEAAATTEWEEFQTGGSSLFLWEAFVSGKAKGRDHVDDARIAVEEFHRSLPDPSRHNVIHEDSVLSLLGVALLRTGWTTQIDALEKPTVVIRPAARADTGPIKHVIGTTNQAHGKKCPECGLGFKGSGWGGIDAHWKAAHTDIMSYKEAWPIIRNGRRPSAER